MSQYFNPDPSLPHERKALRIYFQDRSFVFLTDRGTFSRAGLDHGSRLLLQEVLAYPLKEGARILDLGCAWGALALIFGSYREDCVLEGSDVNPRAVEMAQANAQALGQERISFLVADGIAEGQGPYDLILCNPPIRAGKKTCFRLYREAHAALKEGGALWVVIRKKQGAASTAKELGRLFEKGSLRRVAQDSGYQLYRAAKESGE